MRTPGALARHVIFKLDIFALFGAYLTLALHFLTPIVVDSVICFAILWEDICCGRRVKGKPLSDLRKRAIARSDRPVIEGNRDLRKMKYGVRS